MGLQHLLLPPCAQTVHRLEGPPGLADIAAETWGLGAVPPQSCSMVCAPETMQWDVSLVRGQLCQWSFDRGARNGDWRQRINPMAVIYRLFLFWTQLREPIHWTIVAEYNQVRQRLLGATVPLQKTGGSGLLNLRLFYPTRLPPWTNLWEQNEPHGDAPKMFQLC